MFERRISRHLLAGRERQAEPTTVILLGQQGAGKTRISDAIAQRLNEHGGFVDLDADLYKPYHPDYDELMTLDDRQMAFHIGPDARQWVHQARAYALENGLNLLAHDTAGDARFSAGLVRAYRDAGRPVEIVALGVHRALSDQGVLNRYYEQVQERGHGRLSVPEKVEAAYTGMLAYADIVDAERSANAVTVYRRGESTPRYFNQLDESGQWEHRPTFRQALDEARNHSLTAKETAEFLRIQDKLKAVMSADFRSQLDTISQQAAPLLHRETVEHHESMRLASLAFPQGPRGVTEVRRQDAASQPPPPGMTQDRRPDLDR